MDFSDEAVAQARARKLAQVPETIRDSYRQAWSGKRAAGIRAFCAECCGGSKAEVRRCVSTTCPLWELRPYKLPEQLRGRPKRELTPEQRAAAVERLAKARKARSQFHRGGDEAGG